MNTSIDLLLASKVNRAFFSAVLMRVWSPLAILLGCGIAQLFSGWPAGTFVGLAIIVLAVIIAIPVSGPAVTLISASMGALYFAYFVPPPVAGWGAVFMEVVPGFFALAPIAAVLSLMLDDARPSTKESVSIKRPDEKVDAVLHDVGSITEAASSYTATLDRIAHLAIPRFADWIAVYEQNSAGVPRRIRIAAPSPAHEEALEHALHILPRQLGGHDPLADVAQVLHTSQMLLLTDRSVAGFATAGRNSSERLMLDGLEAGSLIMAPLRARGRLLGVMVFARARSHGSYRDTDLPGVLEFTRRAALSFDNAKRFETALAERAEAETTRDELLRIVDNLSSGFIALDHDGRVTQMNRAAEAMTARTREELLGRNLWQTLAPHTREAPLSRFVQDASRRRSAATTELSITWSGDARWLEVYVVPSQDGASLYIRDVTDRRTMADRLRVQEDALRESQKMEAVGRLSGRLAHDFNNLLMSIAGSAELLRKRIGTDESLREDIQEILRSTERASTLTRQLMTYSRKQVHQPRIIDLGGVISEMQRRLGAVLREDIHLVVRVGETDALVNVDPSQIEQMLLNFAMNSRDAMVDGGTLTIAVSKTELTTRPDSEHPHLEPGSYVCLEVTDTGRGIEPANLPHVFEPFFTTKPANKGTGLGLASVHGIVKQNHGSISASSTVGRGTTFQVLFPAAIASEFEDQPPTEYFSSPPVVAHDTDEPVSGTILVAEDEPTVRKFVCEVLRQRGYTVLEARTGVEGLAVARRQTEPIDLLLTDVIMPEMGGRDLASRIRESAPETRILFMSGYAENEIAHHGVLTSGAQLLEKPFSATTLLQRVRIVMDEPPAVVRFTTPAA